MKFPKSGKKSFILVSLAVVADETHKKVQVAAIFSWILQDFFGTATHVPVFFLHSPRVTRDLPFLHLSRRVLFLLVSSSLLCNDVAVLLNSSVLAFTSWLPTVAFVGFCRTLCILVSMGDKSSVSATSTKIHLFWDSFLKAEVNSAEVRSFFDCESHLPSVTNFWLVQVKFKSV